MGGNHRSTRGPGLRRLGSVIYGADDELCQWIAKHIPGYSATPGAKALGVIKGGKLVAAVVYERHNGVHCEVSIVVDDKARWADRRTLHALFHYPFVQLGCLAISATIPSTNIESLNLCAKLGFKPVAIVRFAAPDGSPLIVMQQERQNCEWLAYGQEEQSARGA